MASIYFLNPFPKAQNWEYTWHTQSLGVGQGSGLSPHHVRTLLGSQNISNIKCWGCSLVGSVAHNSHLCPRLGLQIL